jgi:hypothetical protein
MIFDPSRYKKLPGRPEEQLCEFIFPVLTTLVIRIAVQKKANDKKGAENLLPMRIAPPEWPISLKHTRILLLIEMAEALSCG